MPNILARKFRLYKTMNLRIQETCHRIVDSQPITVSDNEMASMRKVNQCLTLRLIDNYLYIYYNLSTVD